MNSSGPVHLRQRQLPGHRDRRHDRYPVGHLDDGGRHVRDRWPHRSVRTRHRRQGRHPSDLDDPVSLHLEPGTHGSDLYIADAGNNRIQEVAATTQTEWGQSMTAAVRLHGGRQCGRNLGPVQRRDQGDRAHSSPPSRASPSTATATCSSPTPANCRVEEVAGVHRHAVRHLDDAVDCTRWRAGTQATARSVSTTRPPTCRICGSRPRYATRTATCTSPTSGNNRVQEVAGPRTPNWASP